MQSGGDFCRILVLSEDGSDHVPNTQCGSQLGNQPCLDATCRNPADHLESPEPFPPCLVTVDIEKGASDVSSIDQETCGSIKTEISLTVSP